MEGTSNVEKEVEMCVMAEAVGKGMSLPPVWQSRSNPGWQKVCR